MSDNDAAKLKQENNQDQEHEVTMEDLMDKYLDVEGVSIDIPTAGEIRDGIIASLSDNQILVSIGAKSEGIISGREFENIPKMSLLLSKREKQSQSMSSHRKITRAT